MIEVELPDGAIAEFPDGTPPDVIKGALRKKFAVNATVARKDIGASIPDAPVGPMSWGQVGQQALQNTPASAKQFASDMVQPILHPIQTAQAVSDLATGAVENYLPINAALNKIGLGRDQATVEKEKQLASGVGQFYKDRYGSMEGFKRSVAQDPVGVAGDAATILTGGETAAARILGATSKTARTLGTASRVVNPLTVPDKALKATGKVVGGTAKAVLGSTTGTSGETIGAAFNAGREGGEASRAFRDNLRGKVDQTDVIDEARGAVDNIAEVRGKQYQDDMRAIKADKTPLEFGPIEDTFQGLVDSMHHEGHAAVSKKTIGKLREIGEVIDEWSQSPKLHNAIGFDVLKRRIDDLMPVIGDSGKTAQAERAVTQMRNAVKKVILERFPQYAKAMENYESSKSAQREIERSLSLGKGNTADTTLRKLQSLTRNNVNTNYGARQQSANLLKEAGAETLMPKLAGQAMNTWTPRGMTKQMATVAAAGLGGAGFFNPAVWGALAGAPAFSPRLVGEATRGVGTLARYFDGLPKPTKEQLLLMRQLGIVGSTEQE